MSNSTLAGWLKLPRKIFSSQQLQSFISALSYESPFVSDDGSRKTIDLYRLTDDEIALPIEWMKVNYPSVFNICSDRRVTTGEFNYKRLPDPKHPAVKDPAAQEAFMAALDEAVQAHASVLAYAPTGSGKTVTALRTAALLGHRTLVLVHTNQLKEQWIKEAKDKLGLQDDDIGVIQQKQCDYEGKSIVIGLLQTVARREFPVEVYNAFGTVIVDECHKLSTEFFAEALPKFNAKYRIGLTATPKRKDGSDIVLYAHLGQIRVKAETKVAPVKVYTKKYYTKRKLWGSDYRQRLSCLAKDADRNNLVIEYVSQLYKADRNILVVSHSVKHLEHLIELAKQAGVDHSDIGQFTATKSVTDQRGKITGKKTTSSSDLTDAKTKKVIFATYNIMREGIDIPRLDAGIDALPDYKATQLLGRIRRYVKGKLLPKWITIRDMKCSFSEEMWNSRVKEYQECGATVVELK